MGCGHWARLGGLEGRERVGQPVGLLGRCGAYHGRSTGLAARLRGEGLCAMTEWIGALMMAWTVGFALGWKVKSIRLALYAS